MSDFGVSDSYLAVNVPPVLFNENTSVFKTLCKILHKNKLVDTKLHGCGLPLYEDWHSDTIDCIAEVARNNIESVLVIPSSIKCKTLLARLRFHLVEKSLVRPKLAMLFHFGKNQKVSGTILSIGVSVWHVRFESNESERIQKPGDIVSESQLNVSEGSVAVGPNQSGFGGLAEFPEGLVSKGSGAFRCTADHAGKPIRVLLDTGACASFVGPDLVKSLKLDTLPGTLNIHSAGNQSIAAFRFVPRFSVVIDCSEYFAKLWVVDIPRNIDIILGCDWLQENGVLIDMAKRSAYFPKTRVDKIKEIHGHVSDLLSNPSLQLASQQMLNSVPNISTIVSHEDSCNHPQPLTKVKGWPDINPVNTLQLLAALDLYGRETDSVIELGDDGINTIPHESLKSLLQKYEEVFPADIPPGIPPIRERLGQYSIIPMPEGTVPVYQRQYRLSPLEREELRRQIKYMQEMKWIRRSTSPWASPVLFVSKGDGKLRLCVDLRKVNALTIKNRTPIPRIDDLLDQVKGSCIFTALDLAAGYHQIPIPEHECERTAFFGESELWEYTVMPFGLCNAPGVFTAALTRILEKYINVFVLAYLDDILIYSKTPAEHLKHIQLVLDEFKECKIVCRAHKCRFNRLSLPYLGHILSVDGVKPDPRKVQIVVDWPMPLTSVKDVEKFLGLTNYFRKYILGYGTVSAPISDLRRKNVPFIWSPECEKAAGYLKKTLSEEPLLTSPDFSEGSPQFQLITDASGLGIGAALFQGDKVIAYEGRKYRPAEVNYTVGEQELLAVVHALYVWRCYLEGAPKFQVVTDHNPLVYFHTQTTLSRRQSRWFEFISRFDFEWVYRPGKLNVADPLSRAPSLRDQPVEYLHDGLILSLIDLPVGLTRSPGEILSSLDKNTMQQLLVGTQKDASVKQVYVFALMSILSVVRGRTHTRKGGQLLSLATNGRQNTRSSQRKTVSFQKDVILDYPMSSVETDRSEYGPDSAHMREDNQKEHEGDGDVRTAEQPNISNVEQSYENDSERENSDSGEMDLNNSDDEDETIHQLLTDFTEMVIEGYTQDDWFSSPTNTSKLILDEKGLYWREHQLAIPDYASLRKNCIELSHDAPWSGHFGRDKTAELVKQIYWWPKMDQDIADYVRTCDSCQRTKVPSRKPYGLMVPLGIPKRRWSSISIDFITQLPPSLKGNDSIMVVVDRLSKMMHAIPNKTTDNAEDCAKLFVDKIYCSHGLPLEIISDRDTKFTSDFWKELMRLLNVKQGMSTSYHPRTDGQTERTNRTLEEVLRSFISPDQSDWDDLLPLAEFAINNSINVATGSTPFLMNYGQSPITPASMPIMQNNSGAQKFMANWESQVKKAKHLMKMAQARQSKYFNQKVTEQEFEPGTLVMLSTINLRQKGQSNERTKKLGPKFVGPFKILERVGKVSYRLEIPKVWKIHDVFHICLLKEYHTDERYAKAAPHYDVVDKCIHFHIQAIVGEKLDKKGRKLYLVKWTGYDDETWEPEENLIADSPEYARKKIREYVKRAESRTRPSKKAKRNQ